MHRIRTTGISTLALVAFTSLSLYGCSGGASLGTPSGNGGGGSKQPQQSQVSVKLKITKTTKGGMSRGRRVMGQSRNPLYVSPATNGLAIYVYPDGQSQPNQPTVVVNVSGGNGSPCVQDPDGTRTCTISFQAAVGLETFTVDAYDQAPVGNQIPASANLLSAGTIGDQQIAKGVVNTVDISLGGQVASIAVFPSPVLLALGNGQSQSYPLSVQPLDADGYIIVPLVGQNPFNNGNGKNITVAVTAGDPTGQVTIVPPSGSEPPTDYTVNYTGETVADATITASLPGVPSGTTNMTPLNVAPASLTLTFQHPVQTAPATAQIAQWTGLISSTSVGTACSVSPASQQPKQAGGTVTFTVTATNSGNCTASFWATTAGGTQTVQYQLPVAVDGTGVGTVIGSGKIKHIVLIIQENRSFDNIFGGTDDNGNCLTGADTACNPTDGIHVPHDSHGNPVKLDVITMGPPNGCFNPNHDHANQELDIDGGNMDGFDLTTPDPVPCPKATPTPAPPDWVYSTIAYPDVQAYWEMAEAYTIADHHFEQISTASFTEHLVLASANNGGAIDNPTLPGNAKGQGFGCDDPLGTYENIYNPSDPNSAGLPGGPPCYSWPTLADVMTQRGLNWLYYAPARGDFGYQWSSLDAFQQDRFGSIWSTNVINPNTQIVNDIIAGHLPSFAWVVPQVAQSDHPRSGTDSGPPYVSDIVNCIGGVSPCAGTPYWNSSVIFLLWDDFGGFYDHIPPPPYCTGSCSMNGIPAGLGPGYGLRTGLIVMSPYVKQPNVFKPFVSSAAILKFIEGVFNIPSMGGYDTDPNSADVSQMFDFNMPPQPFKGPFTNGDSNAKRGVFHRSAAQKRLEAIRAKAERGEPPDTY